MDNVGVAAFGVIMPNLQTVAVAAPVNHMIEEHARLLLVFQQRFRELWNGVDATNTLCHPRVFSTGAHDGEEVQCVREVV